MRKVRLRRILLAVFASAASAMPAMADTSTLNVSYTIAFWAIPFGHTAYDGKIAANDYSAKMHFETSGVVSLFWKSKIDAVVNGGIGAHSITPSVYDSYSQDRDKPVQRVKVSFGKDGPETLAEPPYNTSKYPVTDEQKKGAIDPMTAITAILSGVKVEAKNPCGTGVQVFDGRRRYDVTFSYVKDEPVKLTSGVFNGNAHLCEVHYNQIAGYKQKIVKEGKELPKMFVDFADISAAGAPNGHYVVAVKLWSTLSLGTVTATLDALKVDGAAAKG